MASIKRVPVFDFCSSGACPPQSGDMDNHLHSVGQSLGFIYDAGAVIPDGSTRPAYNPRVYTPIDRPGSRFPHRWMDAARTETTLDWFDQAFVLVTGTSDPQAELASAVTTLLAGTVADHPAVAGR